MTDLVLAGQLKTDATNRTRRARQWGVVALTVVAALLTAALALTFANAAPDASVVVNSTPGQLALWMAEQSAEEAPVSLLGQYAKDWARRLGAEQLDAAIILNAMRNGVVLISSAACALLLIGAVGLLRAAVWSRRLLLLALLGLVTLLFVVSPEGGARNWRCAGEHLSYSDYPAGRAGTCHQTAGLRGRLVGAAGHLGSV